MELQKKKTVEVNSENYDKDINSEEKEYFEESSIITLKINDDRLEVKSDEEKPEKDNKTEDDCKAENNNKMEEVNKTGDEDEIEGVNKPQEDNKPEEDSPMENNKKKK